MKQLDMIYVKKNIYFLKNLDKRELYPLDLKHKTITYIFKNLIDYAEFL